jgi:PhnB protein
MTTQPKAVQPIPEGYHSVTPWIISRDTAKLLDFMSKAFGAQELGRVYNEDGDAVYQQALAAGATAVTEMTSLAFGDRVGRVRDPFGNLWWIQTRLENLDLEEMAKRAAEQPYRDTMRYFQESLDQELSSRGHQQSR